MRLLPVIAAGALLISASPGAFATPLQWTISEIGSFHEVLPPTVDAGFPYGWISGSYVYDSSTNTYSSINVTMILGVAPDLDANQNVKSCPFDGSDPACLTVKLSFLLPSPFTNNSSAFDFAQTTGNLANSFALGASINGVMSDAGGTLSVSAAALMCMETNCSDSLSGSDPTWSAFFDVTAGPVVPIPAALPLFATGLGGLGLLGWRRKRNGLLASSLQSRTWSVDLDQFGRASMALGCTKQGPGV